MGAGQSSASSADAGPDVKTSYYKLLGIDRQATEEDIKKAYRRKALELHPDRNFGNEEAATKIFAEIQAAYEVLSDSQERAWYDSHESAILRGEDPEEGDAPSYQNVRITTADDLARLVRKFNSNVEFTDAPSGFFGFVRDTFDHLAREEEAAGAWENIEAREYPTFGHKSDEYGDAVRQFYSVWSSFATIKTFSWKDKYRLSEAPDRWYRRRMEQENARIRQDAKREFNDAVRSLVAFIRKRDPRYMPNTQSEQERQQILRDAAAAQAARARAANAAKVEGDVPEWTRVRDPEDLEESEEEQEEQELLECVACNKTFKSENQWEAHERSKKHQKALKSLQQKMRKENAKFDLEEETELSEPDSVKIEGHESDIDLDGRDMSPLGASQDQTGPQADSCETDDYNAEMNRPLRTSEDAERLEDASDTENNSDYASVEAIRARVHSTTLASPISAPGMISDSESEAVQNQKPAKSKLGKAAQKRAKKAAAAAASYDVEAKASQQCETCNEIFPSRTLLFKHISKEGHAALKATGGSEGDNKKKKRWKRN